jgi:hypothetical protein
MICKEEVAKAETGTVILFSLMVVLKTEDEVHDESDPTAMPALMPMQSEQEFFMKSLRSISEAET